jgi:outer membrane lipoprotein-sorting protein
VRKIWILLLLAACPLFGISQKDLSKVTVLMEKVDRFYQENPKLKGSFSLYMNGNERKGYFLYQAPDKLKLFFGPEEAEDPEKHRYIVTNGNILWIYLPQYTVLIEQEIPEYFQQIGKLGINISRFFGSYGTFVLEEEKNENGKDIILSLKNPVKEVPYQEITFIIQENGFVRGMKGKTVRDGQTTHVSFYRYNLKADPEFTEKEFKVRPSGDVQILRNVLMKNKK